MKDSGIACGGGQPTAWQKLESVDWSRFADLADHWARIEDEDGGGVWTCQGARLRTAGGDDED